MTFVRFIHFAPDNKAKREEGQSPPRNKSKIWAVIGSDEEPSGGYGYIENIFGIEEIDSEKHYPINIISQMYMEHANGGRTNTKEYNSIQEYWDDPKVKENVLKSYSGSFTFQISYNGNPDQIDVKQTFEVVGFEGKTFTLYDSLYEEEPPMEWYSLAFPDIIDRLKKQSIHLSAEDAINAQLLADDLFGERYFPILKAPKELNETMQEICENFKGHSQSLCDGEYIYIGIRSKVYEIGAIEDIYREGGAILVDTQWDWS